VLIPVPFGLAQADAVDDAGMVQLVADDGVFLAQQRLKQTAVRIKARGIENGILCPQETGDGLLQILVELLGPADKPDRSQAEAPPVIGSLRCGNESRIIR